MAGRLARLVSFTAENMRDMSLRGGFLLLQTEVYLNIMIITISPAVPHALSPRSHVLRGENCLNVKPFVISQLPIPISYLILILHSGG